VLFLFCKNGASQHIPYCDKGSWGFSTIKGEITIPCTYEEVGFFSIDSLAIVKNNRKYGCINYNGEIVIPIKYDNCYGIYETYSGKYSIGIKENPSIHLNTQFDYNDKNNNRYIVSKNDLFGVVNVMSKGIEEVVPLQFSKIQFDPGKKVFYCSGKSAMFYYDMQGKELSEEMLSSVKIEENYIPEPPPQHKKPQIFKMGDKVGVVREVYNRKEKKVDSDTIVPALYDEIITEEYKVNYTPGKEIFGVRKADLWGFVDGKGNLLLAVEFDSVNFELSRTSRRWSEFQRMLVVEREGKWGIFGKKKDEGGTAIPILQLEYDTISVITDSFLSVKKGNKYQIFSIAKYRLCTNKGYTTITKNKYGIVNGFEIFEVNNKSGTTVYLGENGVEFFND